MSVIQISGTPSIASAILQKIKELRDKEDILWVSLEDIALAKKLPHKELKKLLSKESEGRGYSLVQLLSTSREEPLVSVRHEVIFVALQQGFSRTLLARFFQKDISLIRYIENKYRGKLKRPFKCQPYLKLLSDSVDINNQVKIPVDNLSESNYHS